MFKYTLLSDRSPSCVADEQIQLVCLWEDAEDKEDTEVCGWMAGCIHAFSHVCIILAAHWPFFSIQEKGWNLSVASKDVD